MSTIIIQKSPLTYEVFNKVKQLGNFATTVLIEGEVGTGKKLIAEAIHNLSNRSNMPFIRINCGSLSDQLYEVDFDGIERVSIGATKKITDLFESADQGTLFLDEVGELSPKLQITLLRFIQDQENNKVGGSWSKKIDIRIIASSTCSVNQLVKEGKFRGDLYYRLHVAYLQIAPLRNRPEEITPLLEHYLHYFCKEYKIQRRYENVTLEILRNYQFPGNVQELKNIAEVLCVSTKSDVIYPSDLPEYITLKPMAFDSLESQVGELERRIIIQALQMDGSIRKAATRLKISHATLLRKMQKWGIEKEL